MLPVSPAASEKAPRHESRLARAGTGVRFLLPNLLTVGNICSGFWAVAVSLGPRDLTHLRWAAFAILLGTVLDGLDGRLARLTHAQSSFGRELDSLADLITFGVAPAVVIYGWRFHDWGAAGLAASAVYVVAGAIRLARFNAKAAEAPSSSPFLTLGLPIPMASGALLSAILILPPGPTAKAVLLFTTLSLSALMISRVQFRTFTDARGTLGWALSALLTASLLLSAAAIWSPAAALFAFFWGFLLTSLWPPRS